MAILVVNDDGIESKGLWAVRENLLSLDDVTVVAPDREQSAVGHAITLTLPLRVRKVYRDGELAGYSSDGTPADCVKLAFRVVMRDRLPWLVVSGINKGANLGTAMLYSGTVSAATEGRMMGAQAVAVSMLSDAPEHYETATAFIGYLAQILKEKPLPDDIYLNVNVPDVPLDEVKGVRVVPQGRTFFDDFFEKRFDLKGKPYYWMGGSMFSKDKRRQTDFSEAASGCITVTPIHFDLTSYDTLDIVSSLRLDKFRETN